MARRLRSEIDVVESIAKAVPALPPRKASDQELALARHDLEQAIEALQTGADLAQFGAMITAALTRLAVASAIP